MSFTFTLHYKKHVILLLVMVFILALGYSNQDYICSRATYYGSPDCLGNSSGACGYGEYGRNMNNGYVAAVHRPYRNGAGCSGCYQVTCKAKDRSVQVMVWKLWPQTWGVGGWPDFLFAARAYAKMAQPGFEAELLSHGVVDIEYRRVPCRYDGSTLTFKIHEGSKFPYYLALIVMYPPGVYDIIAVQIWPEDYKTWKAMRKTYGAVWDMENPPRGELKGLFG